MEQKLQECPIIQSNNIDIINIEEQENEERENFKANLSDDLYNQAICIQWLSSRRYELLSKMIGTTRKHAAGARSKH